VSGVVCVVLPFAVFQMIDGWLLLFQMFDGWLLVFQMIDGWLLLLLVTVI